MEDFNNMDGTEKRQDNPEKETLDATKGTSQKEPETFTREQMAETRKKASDALADVGRLKKAVEQSTAAAQKANEIATAAHKRANDMIEEQRAAELEKHRDDPAELKRIRAEQKATATQSKLDESERKRAEAEGKLAEAQEVGTQSTKERNAREIATRLGVDSELLLKFGGGSKESMEELAAKLPKKEVKDPLLVDTGETIGGSGKTHEQKLKDRYPTMAT